MNRLILGATGLVLALFVGISALFAVQQTQQVLITQFGEPMRVIREPGLAWKIPFIQTVITFDRRLLDFPAAGQEVILGDQRRLVVDTFTMYRITDPLRFYQTVGATEAGIRLRLQPIVSSALRNTLGNEPLLAVLSADRARIMGEIRTRVNQEAQSFGIEVTDVRIRRADLPDENTQAILSRMQSERERVAREERAQGAEQAQRIRASAERERTVLIAEAQSQAEILRGQGEQTAIRIFAEAFQQDPEFFQFWRTMQAWREAFADGDARLLLSPDSDFFRYFRTIPQPGAAAARAAAAPAPSPATAPAAAREAPAPAPAAPAPAATQ
jgi:membrane protease subunit HflC